MLRFQTDCTRSYRPLLLAAPLLMILGACTETRVIKDNSVDSRFGRSMPSGYTTNSNNTPMPKTGTSKSLFK